MTKKQLWGWSEIKDDDKSQNPRSTQGWEFDSPYTLSWDAEGLQSHSKGEFKINQCWYVLAA